MGTPSPLPISPVSDEAESDKAASVLLLHDIPSVMSALHSYLSGMYFSPWHMSLLLLYSVGTVVRDPFFSVSRVF